MQIDLLPGDFDWTENGLHVYDSNGFAIFLSEPKTLEVSEEVAATMIPFIEGFRVHRGLNPDGSIPEPPAEEPIVPEPTVEEPITQPDNGGN
jgi:hypothetical protein